MSRSKKGEVNINLREDNLLILPGKVLATRMKPGKQVVVISSPLKKIILNGITTLSTDFRLMGEKTAELIPEQLMQQIAIPFALTLRNTLQIKIPLAGEMV